MEVSLWVAGSRRPPGGWKCTPLGQGSSSSWKVSGGSAAQLRSASSPYSRLKARVNASCEPYPASTPTSSTERSVLSSR